MLECSWLVLTSVGSILMLLVVIGVAVGVISDIYHNKQ